MDAPATPELALELDVALEEAPPEVPPDPGALVLVGPGSVVQATWQAAIIRR
jgi:hypothetical protein